MKTRTIRTSVVYREEILEHYKTPLNFGRIDLFNASSKQLNPFCGDEIEIFIQYGHSTHFVRSGQKSLSKEQVIKNISFFGRGCAISIAGASLLTEYVKGKAREELTKMSEDDMLELLGIDVSEARKKCALLALAVLKDCFYENSKSQISDSK